MEDVIKKYKSEKRKRNIAILTFSLALAFGLNFMILWTDTWKYMQASVLNSDISTEAWDIYIIQQQKWWDTFLNISSSKILDDVKNISFTITYNPEEITLKNKSLSIDWSSILELVNEEGINTLSINLDESRDLRAKSRLLQILVDIDDIDSRENIAIVNANYTDSNWETHSLSSSTGY